MYRQKVAVLSVAGGAFSDSEVASTPIRDGPVALGLRSAEAG